MKTVEIVDTEDKLTMRVNGALVYNYHGVVLQALRKQYGRNTLIAMMFQPNLDGGFNTIFDMFIEQLREDGYFDEDRTHPAMAELF